MQELIYWYVYSQGIRFIIQVTISQEWAKYCEVALESLEKVMAHNQ